MTTENTSVPIETSTPIPSEPPPIAAEPGPPDEEVQLAKIWEKGQADKEPDWTDTAEMRQAKEQASAEKTPPAEAPKATPEQAAIEAPVSWKNEMRERWSTFTPEAQQYIAEREKDAAAKISQQGNELKAFEPVREIYGAIQQMGVPAGREPEVIANWARAQQVLDRNPVEGLKWLANSYKVDVRKLVDAASQGDDWGDLNDPRIDRIQSDMQELRSQNLQLHRAQVARQLAETEAQYRETESFLREFFRGKPDIDLIEGDIEKEIAFVQDSEPNLSREQTLERAYERARWANEQSRQRILTEERQKETDEKAKKAQKAKRIASMNMRTGATATTSSFDGKWDDSQQLSELYDHITAGKR